MTSDGTTVADLFEAAAEARPGAVAVVAGDTSLTYGDLDARANRLAHHLQARGVGPDVLVGVCLPRSLDLAVALVAVLKAGGACVPLDPAYPRERLAFLAGDAGLATVLTDSARADILGSTDADLIRMDADDGDWAGQPSKRPVRLTGPGHLAYVIYTSGSTGEAKGVLLTHRGLVHHHRAVVDLYRLGPADRVLQFCAVGFDASVEEMFPTWAAGAAVVFRPERDVPLLGPAWLAWLRDRGVTVVNLPTAYWHAWARDLDDGGERVPDAIRLVVVGGEKALGAGYGTWLRVGGGRARWVNAYGPTETTCMSTYYEAGEGGDGEDPPIGRPLGDTSVVVVDERLVPVPDGVIGELLIGGPGVARGYLGRAALTAERFVHHGAARGRAYRTGDLVRRLPGGDLAYIGRRDGQVKVQGYRVECGEVETVLSRHDAVAGVAVVGGDDGQLGAYVVARPGSQVDGTELRRFLADRLPAHMVPTAFVFVGALPLTVHGKVDRDALPAAVPSEPSRPGAAPARTPGEDRMAAIWARVLGLDEAQLRDDDDFFDLGGHSLLATQVVARLREEFGTETPLRAIFEAPTLGALTAIVEAGAATAPTTTTPLRPVPHRPGEAIPLSLAQEQMYALELAARPPGLYNFTAIRRFSEDADEAALRTALAHLVGRHEILRTGFVGSGDGPRQIVAPAHAVTADVTVFDLRGGPPEGREEAIRKGMAAHEAQPFELSRPPLFRVGLWLVDAGDTRLAVTFDHLVSDGTGAAIFLAELDVAYAATIARRAPQLPPLPVQFADFALWQRSHITDAALAGQLDWWREALDRMPLGPAIPVDQVPSVPTRRIAAVPVAVDGPTRRRLEHVARETGSTVFAVVAAAAAVVLGRRGERTDIVFSTTVSGRTRAELDALVGTFSGMSRIRVDLAGDPPFAVVVARARDWLLGMSEHQNIPFLRVRRAVLPDFPTDGRAVAAALPVELQYFHAPADQEFLFRGQLHPLSLTVLDDGRRLSGELSYKLDFYAPETVDQLAADLDDVLRAAAAQPSRRISELGVSPSAIR